MGGFTRPSLNEIRGVDWKGASLISKIVKSIGDNNSLKIIIEFLKNENLNILSVKDIIPSLFVEEGSLTEILPSKKQKLDINLGKEIISLISRFDIGQSIVISSRRVLGIEGPEGTDSLIKRCTNMPYEDKPLLVKLLNLH